MANRQREKERRRQERIAREQAAARAEARRKRAQMVFGGLLAVAAIAGVVLAVALSGGGDTETEAARPGEGSALPQLPPQQESDVRKAADAAGCDLVNAPYEGAGHAAEEFTAADYETNPPTSGTHFPEWYEDGIYAPGTTPNVGMFVHTLEHGRVNVQYKPGTPAQTVRELEAFLAESNDGYHMLLYENTTDMPYEVAATAWTQLLGCKRYNDKTIDALRTFRTRYVDKGPENVP